MRASKVLCTVVMLAPLALEAQIEIRPGQYEVTFDLDLGIPADGQKAVMDAAGAQKNKQLECFTAADVKGGMWQMFAREVEGENCKASNVKTTGNKMTFTLTCEEDDVRVVTNNDVTFGPDWLSGTTKFKDAEGVERTSKYSAKRVGDCKE